MLPYAALFYSGYQNGAYMHWSLRQIFFSATPLAVTSASEERANGKGELKFIVVTKIKEINKLRKLAKFNPLAIHQSLSSGQSRPVYKLLLLYVRDTSMKSDS